MEPTLRDRDVVLVRLHAYNRRPPRPGEMVLARHPFRRDIQMIKRVVRVTPDRRVVLAGDNPAESHDSRGFGALPLAYLRGRVVRVVWHAARRQNPTRANPGKRPEP